MMDDSPEIRLLESFFAGLGAPPPQARVMARQTRKRASQLSVERGVSEAEALRYLMELAQSGRSGKAVGIETIDRAGGDKVDG